MQIKLHANARLTPKQREEIQKSAASVRVLAKSYGVTETTIRRWRSRAGTVGAVADRSHKRHRLGQSTSMIEEEIIVALRQDVGLSIEDIVHVIHQCVNNKLSRSAIYRCLKRHGVHSLPQNQPEVKATPHGRFDDVPCGFIHIDLKHLTALERQASYVFVAIDRATRFAHIEIIYDRSAATVARALENFIKKFPHKIHTILTDNGSEFTDRFAEAVRLPKGRIPTGNHAFDRVCTHHGIKHKLTKPFHPQTNGMVERFNRRLAEAIRQKAFCSKNSGRNKFLSHQERNLFLLQLVDNYNKTSLRCLDYISPIQSLHNLTEDYTFAGMTLNCI